MLFKMNILYTLVLQKNQLSQTFLLPTPCVCSMGAPILDAQMTQQLSKHSLLESLAALTGSMHRNLVSFTCSAGTGHVQDTEI